MLVEQLFDMTLGQLERLEQVEAERDATMMDVNFQQWMKDLNVSRLFTDRESINRANELNSQYDYSKRKNKVAGLIGSLYL